MNVRNLLILSMLVTATGFCRAQGYYDDDIYFDSSKDKDKNIEQAKKRAKATAASPANGYILYPVADYPAADTYVPDGTLAISVDEYNRRGIFAKDSVSNDSVRSSSGFEYTRQIERFYNPAIVKGSGDTELSQMYYAQPANVNIYINTPGYGYWGYPYNSWGCWYDPWFYGPGYWYSYNHWGYPWYWGSPAWGPSWSWGPAYWGPGWGWGASWGWNGGLSRPVSPRHPGALHSRRPGSNIGNASPGNVYRPGYNSGRHDRNNSGYRPAYNNGNTNYRPNYNNSNTTNSNNSNNSYTRPGRHNNSSFDNRNSSGSSYRSNSGGSYRSSGSSTGGRSTGGGGRGRH